MRPCNSGIDEPWVSIGNKDLPEAQIDHVTEAGSPWRQLIQLQKVLVKGVISGGGLVNGSAALVNARGVLGVYVFSENGTFGVPS